jgi:hypothetical protein
MQFFPCKIEAIFTYKIYYWYVYVQCKTSRNFGVPLPVQHFGRRAGRDLIALNYTDQLNHIVDVEVHLPPHRAVCD